MPDPFNDNQLELIDKALKTLINKTKLETKQRDIATERLEALSKITAKIPWDEVATLSIGWESFNNSNCSTDLEFFPTLHVVMKEQMT
jgi:hypothetical protein